MTLEDLTTEDGRIAFKDYKYSFRLTGDFNGDGLPDQAIAGRFENPQNGRDVSFAAILTMRKNQWQREWFYRPDSETTVLQLAPHPDKAKARKGYHAILVQFSEMPSHNYVVIYWNGKKYDAFSGFDTRHWEGYDR